MSEPTLPQGAGYGVGASPLCLLSLRSWLNMFVTWTVVGVYNLSITIHNSPSSVLERRHWSLLQRVYAGVDCCTNPLHRLFPKKRRRIQQRV